MEVDLFLLMSFVIKLEFFQHEKLLFKAILKTLIKWNALASDNKTILFKNACFALRKTKKHFSQSA